MSMYEKIQQGLTNATSERKARIDKERKEYQFNTSPTGFKEAMASKNPEKILAVIEALGKKRQEVYNQIYGGSKNPDLIEQYKSLTASLEELQQHVESLHNRGEI